MTLRPLVAVVLAAACQGCPPAPTEPSSTITGPDGSVQVVSIQTACHNVAGLCGVTEASCESAIADIESNAPVDLVCATRATTKAGAHACVGIGSACPL